MVLLGLNLRALLAACCSQAFCLFILVEGWDDYLSTHSLSCKPGAFHSNVVDSSIALDRMVIVCADDNLRLRELFTRFSTTIFRFPASKATATGSVVSPCAGLHLWHRPHRGVPSVFDRFCLTLNTSVMIRKTCILTQPTQESRLIKDKIVF